MTDVTPDWPQPPEASRKDEELWKAQVGYAQAVATARVNAAIAKEKAELDEQIADRKAEIDKRSQIDLKREDADIASRAGFHAAMVEVSKGTVERARSSAELVQKAAAALVTLYTALLGVVFSVVENPLPSRGLVPAVLLGAAVVLSTVYLAYLSKPEEVDAPTPHSEWHGAAMNRTVAFILWTRSGAMNRAHFLQASVVALAFALVALPAPFVDVTPDPAPQEVAAEAETGWPDAPTGMNVALAKILYQAQVTEAATSRAAAKPAVAGDDDTVWWIGCGVALLVSLLAPFGINWLAEKRTASEGEYIADRGKLPSPMRAP